MHRLWDSSEIRNLTKSQLSSVDWKNNYFLEPAQVPLSASHLLKNSFSTIPKMGPSNDTKIIEMTPVLVKTSFILNLKEIQVCSDLLRVRALVRKYCKTTIYLADMTFDFLPKISHQKSSIHCKIENLCFLKPF